MKRKISFIIIFLSIAVVLLAGQNGAGDDTDPEKKLETVSGTEKLELLNQLSHAGTFNSPEKSKAYGEQALELARTLGDRKGEAAALQNIAAANRILGQYESALQSFQKALTICESLEDKKGAGSILHDMGAVYWNTGNYPKALEYLERALAIAKELDFKNGIASCLNIIGIVYDDMGNFDKALEYYHESLDMYEVLGNKKGYAVLLSNIGVIYRKLNRLDRAGEYYRKALDIETEMGNKEGIARNLNNLGVVCEALKDYPCALDHYRRALEIKRQIGNKRDISSSLMNIGNIYTFMEDYDKASAVYLESLKMKEESGDRLGMSMSLKNLGKFYLTRGDFEGARRYLERGLKIAGEIEAKSVLNDIYSNLSDLYERKQEYKKALDYFKLHLKVKDEILNKASNDKIAETEAKYESEKKEKEIALLEKNNELLKKNSEITALTLGRAKFKANAFIVGFILVFIILLLLFKKYLYLLAFWKRKSFIGHYRILGELGSGGMGIVYKASPLMEKEKTVALKVIRDEYAKDPVHRKRFLNEALLVDQLDHPHIVKVYERGESGRQLFIAMEMLRGESLADVIRRGEKLPLENCIIIMRQVFDAVESIHSRGIVHRDLKPENIMLIQSDDGKPFAKLLDFGLARTGSLSRLTGTGEILGTINYLPPERITRQDFSPAGDIYSLGVVFYEMLTLEKPFLGETPVDVIKQILEKEPVVPSVFRPEIPGELDELIMMMMNKDPEKRPGGAFL